MNFFRRFSSLTALLVSTSLGAGPLHAQPQHHGAASYNPSLYATAPAEGKFSRLFDPAIYKLWPQASPIYDLEALGEKAGPMLEDLAHDDLRGDSGIEAGITFLGQFIDHDITLDVTTQLGLPANPQEVKNFRTADLDLDCVYGGGPEATPFLYDFPRLHVGEELPGGRHDLYRGKDGTALIGDPRNDENIFLAQIQASFIAFHNTMVDELFVQKLDEGSAAAANYLAWKQGGTFEQRALVRHLDEELFATARDNVIHYYHRMLAEYFLPKVIGVGRTLDIATNGPKFYNTQIANIPVEFSAAAYRFGHSQVRQEYKIANDEVLPIFSAGRNGFRPVASNETIDFALFFPIAGRDDVVPQNTRLLDTKLPGPLLNLDQFGVVPPGGDGSLASRNLKRGRTFRLPSGQALFDIIAEIENIEKEESPANYLTVSKDASKIDDGLYVELVVFGDVATEDPSEVVLERVRNAPEIVRETLGVPSTPLWYHVLHEAEVWPVYMAKTTEPAQNWPIERFVPKSVSYLNDDRYNAVYSGFADQTDETITKTGQIMGPVGGRIIGEVMIGLMENYRNIEGKGLDLSHPLKIAGTTLPGFSDRFTFGDMINFIEWHDVPE